MGSKAQIYGTSLRQRLPPSPPGFGGTSRPGRRASIPPGTPKPAAKAGHVTC